MRDSLHTLLFAAALAVVCSFALAAATRFTKPYIKANRDAERCRTFLEVLEISCPDGADAKTLNDIYSLNVTSITHGDLELHRYMTDGQDAGEVIAVAVPFSGPGVWGHIQGVVALQPDLQTIRGIRFYDHEETPGLGGEISAPWFLAQFPGKKMVDAQQRPGFLVRKPSSAPLPENAVDGITGATMTSERVQLIMEKLAMSLASGRAINDD